MLHDGPSVGALTCYAVSTLDPDVVRMSGDNDFSFMPPDEPTAVYPIGASKKKAPAVQQVEEPPEPPTPTAPPAQQGFNPLLALALVGVPVLVALAVVLLFVIVFSFQ